MKFLRSSLLLCVPLLTLLMIASPAFAYSSCEEACPAAADESGKNDYPLDGGGELNCCCIDNGNGFESRPLQECDNL